MRGGEEPKEEEKRDGRGEEREGSGSPGGYLAVILFRAASEWSCSWGGKYIIIPTQEATVLAGAPGGGEEGLMQAVEAADHRCSMGAGAGTASASNLPNSSSTNRRSAPLGCLPMLPPPML